MSFSDKIVGMAEVKKTLSAKQLLFYEMVAGTLVYAVVLGFFEEYTLILSTWSYSITFLAALVMQVLTYLTFWLKSLVVKRFKGREGKRFVAAMVVGVWLILFLSKFVFLAVIEVIFGEKVELSGFVGLMAIIITMTVAKKLMEAGFKKLG